LDQPRFEGVQNEDQHEKAEICKKKKKKLESGEKERESKSGIFWTQKYDLHRGRQKKSHLRSGGQWGVGGENWGGGQGYNAGEQE